MAACPISSLHFHHISVPNGAEYYATRSSIGSHYSANLLRKKPGVKNKAWKTRTSHFSIFAQINKASRSGPKEVVMVDPIEAKRLAVEQMMKLQARAKFKRQRAIEAVNGGWAMLGLTAGMVIEGYTGKTILSQVAGYLTMIADFVEK